MKYLVIHKDNEGKSYWFEILEEDELKRNANFFGVEIKCNLTQVVKFERGNFYKISINSKEMFWEKVECQNITDM